MKNKFSRINSKLLDGERCFREFFTPGKSLTDVAYSHANDGILNRNKEVFAIQSIRTAAWRWALENPDKAKEYFVYFYNTQGTSVSEAEWKEHLLYQAKIWYSGKQNEKKLISWLTRNGFSTTVLQSPYNS